MSHPHAPSNPGAFDELDPHLAGTHGQHASHVIVGPMQLRVVLAILLFFTFLTVAFAWAEQWAMGAFDVHLPWWVNVAGAMAIAVIKALLVMAIFMQLRYDNPINTLAMVFTFGALACFLGFTGIDLFNREKVYEWKSGPVVPGGTGPSRTGGVTITVAAKERFLAKLQAELGTREAALKRFAEIEADVAHHGHAPHEPGDPNANSKNKTRAKTGLSGALSSEAPGSHASPDAGGHH